MNTQSFSLITHKLSFNGVLEKDTYDKIIAYCDATYTLQYVTPSYNKIAFALEFIGARRSPPKPHLHDLLKAEKVVYFWELREKFPEITVFDPKKGQQTFFQCGDRFLVEPGEDPSNHAYFLLLMQNRDTFPLYVGESGHDLIQKYTAMPPSLAHLLC